MTRLGWVLALVMSCLPLWACGGGGGGAAPVSGGDDTSFANPTLVSVAGYSGDVMEPFVSRDGRVLFFNDNGSDKDIYYATWDDGAGIWQFQGRIDSIATMAVDGVPTMDSGSRFYYISTVNYPGSLETIYAGDFDPADPAVVTNVTPVGNLGEGIPGHLNFDVEVSADGRTLYYVDGVFSGQSFPDSADFVYARDAGGGFVRAADSAQIFAQINTPDSLEYAACISRDELEFFFTRLTWVSGQAQTAIYRAVRPDTSSPFAAPQKIAAIEGFVEAPTLSPDEKTLYYHRLNPNTGVFELYQVTRP